REQDRPGSTEEEERERGPPGSPGESRETGREDRRAGRQRAAQPGLPSASGRECHRGDDRSGERRGQDRRDAATAVRKPDRRNSRQRKADRADERQREKERERQRRGAGGQRDLPRQPVRVTRGGRLVDRVRLHQRSRKSEIGNPIPDSRSVGRVRQERDRPGPLDRGLELALMKRARSGNPTRQDLAPFRDESLEELDVLPVDVLELFRAELADLAAANEELLTGSGLAVA